MGISRSIWDDPDFKDEPFTEREAFIWLVGEASWKERKKRGSNGPVNLNRGEFCHSLRFMAKAWKWPKSRVFRFLKRLQNRTTIRDTSRGNEQIYLIKNYNKFQIVGIPDQSASGTANETQVGQQRDKLEEGCKNLKKKDISPKPQKRISYHDDFNSFWLAYPTDANMSKKEAWQEWGKLDSEDKTIASESMKAFNAYCNKNPDYRPIHANRYLKYRRFDGHAEAGAELTERQNQSKVHLIKGTPPFDAWNAYKVSRGERPISRKEWWFPTEWPPGHENKMLA